MSTTYSESCPSFFRANIVQARDPRHGYATAGWHLALHARRLVEGDVAEDRVIDFDEAAEEQDKDRLLSWFLSTLPRCMALVPARRRPSFMRGVMRAIEDGRVW